MFRKFALLTIIGILLIQCSAYQIRHTDDKGTTRTYITDTIFVGTGTFLDCIISPFHFIAGFFYYQPQIVVKGTSINYPSFGGSGCFFKGYQGGDGILGIIPVLPGMMKTNTGNAVFFHDMNQKEVLLMGGTFEVTRVTNRINFSSK